MDSLTVKADGVCQQHSFHLFRRECHLFVEEDQAAGRRENRCVKPSQRWVVVLKPAQSSGLCLDTGAIAEMAREPL